MSKTKSEVCFTPAIFNRYENKDAIVVVIDVLRASSAICTAFANGALSIIPVAEISEAKEFKRKAISLQQNVMVMYLILLILVILLSILTRDKVEGKTIVYSTTNVQG